MLEEFVLPADDLYRATHSRGVERLDDCGAEAAYDGVVFGVTISRAFVADSWSAVASRA